MTKQRQDAWHEESDLLLADIVLRHIREGSTQLNAFEEAGNKMKWRQMATWYGLSKSNFRCGADFETLNSAAGLLSDGVRKSMKSSCTS